MVRNVPLCVAATSSTNPPTSAEERVTQQRRAMSRRLVAASTVTATPVPKDRCWTVPVLAACVSFLFAMPITNSGFFYVLFMEKFSVKREASTWTKTIASITSYLMGFAIAVAQDRLSPFIMIMAGAVLCPVALITSSFAPNIVWMCVTYGFLYGMSFGLLSISTSICIVTYFHKYRSFATGIQYLGVSLSGVIGPSLLSALAATYSLQGTFFLAAGMALHIIPLAMLLRNPSPVVWPGWKLCKKRSMSAEVVMNGTIATVPLKTPDLHHVVSAEQERPQQTTCEKATCRDALEATEILEPEYEQHNNESEVTYVPEKRNIASGLLFQILELLRSPCFYVILEPIIAADFTLPLLATTVVDYAKDKGAPLDSAAQLVSCLCAGGFCGRLLIPLLSDKTPRSRCIIASASFLLLSLYFVLMPHLFGFWVIAAGTFIAGAQQGYLATIKTVLVADYLGVQKVAVSWGVTGLATLPLTFCEPSIVGSFRDNGGSYDNLYRVFAAMGLVAALLLGLQAFIDARKRKAGIKNLS